MMKSKKNDEEYSNSRELTPNYVRPSRLTVERLMVSVASLHQQLQRLENFTLA